jgi:cyclomaltodextrinase / maltogenic alpha-amylase / neopullulanase
MQTGLSAECRRHVPLHAASVRWRKLVVVALLFATPGLFATLGLAAEAPIAFSTSGGDTWTLQKEIELTVAEGHCDEVAITSAFGTTVTRPESSRVRTQIELAPGDNRIQAQCRKDGAVNGAPTQQIWQVRLRDVPKAWVQVSVTETSVTLDASGSERAPTRPSPLVRYHWQARPGNPAPLAGLPGEGSRMVLPIPAADGEFYVTLQATDADGRSDVSTILFRVRDGVPEALDPARNHSSWIDRAVVYGVVPALFGPRGIADVTGQLDRLAALGINTLWLSPITMSPGGDFGYAVTDHFRLRDALGSEADLRELIRSAHSRGLRVLMDFVPNHFSDQHPYFADTAVRGRGSPFFDYFARSDAGEATYYFKWHNLKNLNYANGEVERLMIEAFGYWVREFDVDGFRVDVAWGPRQRAPEFWPRWRRELKRIKPDLLLLAEASAGDPYYGRNGFDAAYDWTDKLGEWAWQDAFDDARTAERLRLAIGRSPSEVLVFRFLENNDTGARFITRHGVPRTRVAAAMLLTLPGIPGLFTGSEIGAGYEPYRQAVPLTWSDPYDLSSWYARLIELRRVHPALGLRQIRWLDVGAPEQVLAYVRPGAIPAEDIIVLLNYGSAPVRATLDQDSVMPNRGGALVDLLTGERIGLDAERPVIPVAGYGVRILKSD